MSQDDVPDQVPETAPFAETIQELAPPWLQDGDSVRILFDLGLNIDFSLDYIRFGVLQRFPDTPITRPEALSACGRDRAISRGRYEPQDSYAGRVRQARTTWSAAGDAPTLLRQIWAYFLPSPPMIRYVVNGVDGDGQQYADWWTITPDGALTRHRSSPNNWNWDGSDGAVRFWIFIYKTLTPIYWGASPVGSGLLWGATEAGGSGASWGYLESSSWYQDVKQIVRQWKCAGSHAGVYSQGNDAGIVGVFDDLMFDPSYPPGGVPGYAMPEGDWNDWSVRADDTNGKCVFLSGV